MVAIEERQKHKDQLRESILETARIMVLQEGWQSVSIRKIADSIGYSLPMVYKFFENKDAILEEFVKQGFGMLGELMRAIQIQHEQPEEQLKAMASAYFEFAFSNRAYYEMMFGLGMPSCERAKAIPELASFSCTIISSIKKISTDADEANIKLKYHTLFSILHGITSINMVNITATSNQMQLMVLNDAVEGFIRNINSQ